MLAKINGSQRAERFCTHKGIDMKILINSLIPFVFVTFMVSTGNAVFAQGDQYGSIVFEKLDVGGYAWGFAWDAESRVKARSAARKACQDRAVAGVSCQEVGWFRNACGALAIGDGNGYGAGWGNSTRNAEQHALSNCRKANRNCRLEVSQCVGESPKVAQVTPAKPEVSQTGQVSREDPGLADEGPSRNPGDMFRDCGECPEMVVVPSGSFMMGSPPGEVGRYDWEGPVHEVTIARSFAVGVYEVTFEAWDACVSGGGCGGYRPDDYWGFGRGRRAVTEVSWEDAQGYVEWLSRKTGGGYRLLSESEWEYVARAGTRTRYWWGDEVGENRANCVVCWSQWVGGPVAVGSFLANGFGLHDVLGNAFEWVEDCWDDSYRGAPTDGSAWESGNCDSRVIRGGNSETYPEILRSAYRNRYTAGERLNNGHVGFRVARTLD